MNDVLVEHFPIRKYVAIVRIGTVFVVNYMCTFGCFRYQREEPFTSISVDIQSHNSLPDSLKEYVKGDLLDNDNAYLCEICNKKVGKKMIIFLFLYKFNCFRLPQLNDYASANFHHISRFI